MVRLLGWSKKSRMSSASGMSKRSSTDFWVRWIVSVVTPRCSMASCMTAPVNSGGQMIAGLGGLLDVVDT